MKGLGRFFGFQKIRFLEIKKRFVEFLMNELIKTRKEMGLPDPRDALMSRIPQGRLGDPMELAGTYVFLASHLSQYVTGQTIVVDGGWQVG